MRVDDFDGWVEAVPVLETGSAEFEGWMADVPVCGNPGDDSGLAGVGQAVAGLAGPAHALPDDDHARGVCADIDAGKNFLSHGKKRLALDAILAIVQYLWLFQAMFRGDNHVAVKFEARSSKCETIQKSQIINLKRVVSDFVLFACDLFRI